MSRSSTWKPRKTGTAAATAVAPPADRVVRRRETETATPEVEGSTTGRQRVTMIALVGAMTLLGACAVAFLLWIGGQSDPVIPDPGPPAVMPASTFHVIYRVDDTASSPFQVETDVISVGRPTKARIEYRAGRPPGGAVTSGHIIDGYSDVTLPDDAKTYATPMTLAFTSELYSAPALDAAVEAGKAEQLGEMRILGRRCTRYRYRHGGIEALSMGTDRENVVSCVTDDGIMLEQKVTLDGRVVRTARATGVQEGASSVAGTFTIGPGEPSADVQATRRVIEGRPAGEQVVEAPAPSGFRVDRRLTDSRQEIDGPLLPFYVESFVGGTESIVSEQYLLRAGGGAPWSSTGGDEVHLGSGRTGQVFFHAGAVEVQTSVDGYAVRVMAPRENLAVYVASTLKVRK